MKRAVLSFSGGKDSSLALYKLQQDGIHVVRLVTTMWRDSGATVAHGENLEKMECQAKRIGIPIDFISTDFENYQKDFLQKLCEIKKEFSIDTIAFGDIYLTGHREWGEELAKAAQLNAHFPLWTKKEKSIDLLYEYVDLGFKSKVTKIDEERLPKNWVGREIDQTFIRDILTYNVCPLGESGEYHTFVYDGPIFSK